jgi:hypothetical protein
MQGYCCVVQIQDGWLGEGGISTPISSGVPLTPSSELRNTGGCFQHTLLIPPGVLQRPVFWVWTQIAHHHLGQVLVSLTQTYIHVDRLPSLGPR